MSFLDLSSVGEVYLACGRTDMMDPFSRALFLFCGRRADRIKGLLWEGDGFLLLYKRLEDGRFQWPRDASEARRITPQQLRWLMEGLSIEQKTAIRELRPSCCS